MDCDEAGMIRSWSRGEVEDDEVDGKVNGKGNEKGRKRLVKKSLGTYIGTLPPVLRYRFPFNYVSYFLPTPHPLILIIIILTKSLNPRF